MVLSDFNDFQNWASISCGLDITRSYFLHDGRTVRVETSSRCLADLESNTVSQLPGNDEWPAWSSDGLSAPLGGSNLVGREFPTGRAAVVVIRQSAQCSPAIAGEGWAMHQRQRSR